LLRLHVNPFDYTILGIYFALVIAIGVIARRAVATSEDFLLSGRSLPAWVTGLAFISANLGAIEILGMAANGAQYGLPTVHFYWIGAVPAMVFLGVVMMPFYYGSRVRSVPEFLLRRFNPATHLFNALTFALAAVLIAGVNLVLQCAAVRHVHPGHVLEAHHPVVRDRRAGRRDDRRRCHALRRLRHRLLLSAPGA
jgi:solute:Na+ symporter, SSS family